MIRVDKLNELNGAERFGSCVSCGSGSKNSTNYRLVFGLKGMGQQSSVTLCDKCLEELGRILNVIDVQRD